MKAFKITGTFQMGRDKQDFTKEIAAADKDAATEKILSDLGSKHNVKRYQIDIADIKPLKNDEITDLAVAYTVNPDSAPKEG